MGKYTNITEKWSNLLEVLCEKGVLKNFAIFTGAHLWWAGLQVCNFTKKKLQHRCFPVNIGKFLWTPILKNNANDCLCNLLRHLTAAICLHVSFKIIFPRHFLRSTYKPIFKVSFIWKLCNHYCLRKNIFEISALLLLTTLSNENPVQVSKF